MKKSFIKRLVDSPPREHFGALLFLIVFSTLLFFANKYWGSSDFFIFKNATSLIEWIIGFVFWAFFFGIAFAVLSGAIVYIIYIWYDFIKKLYVAFKEWKKGK